MPETEAPPTLMVYSDAQLHALACIVCGRGDRELLAAGHVRTEVRPGQHLVWAVVACPDHQDGARC